ncbi:transglutaminase domain-containing protein [Actinoplanes sp. NBRC 103695]|uniref:transglutaminase domain-containing protein n=1 Tax=Actinoplanes sp. NBRC 103695 TaxID=3032202 RepID=UPI002552FFE1|nr:transglutaminase domain-containing protein [Actinoplanes sp. NBRC 103695]
MSDYIEPGMMTDPGEFKGLLDGLPGDAGGVARVVQGLVIHEFLLDSYGVTMTDEQKQTVHLRKVSDLLGVINDKDPRALDVAREPGERVATNCRGYTVLAVTLLRHAGVPARARCGFGAYFGPMKEDHWVAEFHDGTRWRLLDAQLDEVNRRSFQVGFDITDVGPDRFVVAGDAWRRCREGRDDPATFGLTGTGAGYWWIAGNMIRDAAALDGAEALPWDCWGTMPEPGQDPDREFFDRLAAGGIDTAADERIRVPGKVFNAVRNRTESFR